MIYVRSQLPHTYEEYTYEPPTPIGIDFFFFLPCLSGQQVMDTEKVELPTLWIFIRPQITETTGMCSFISLLPNLLPCGTHSSYIAQQALLPRIIPSPHIDFCFLALSPLSYSHILLIHFSLCPLSWKSGFYTLTSLSPSPLLVLHKALLRLTDVLCVLRSIQVLLDVRCNIKTFLVMEED